jgi:hypothetical protein
MEAAYAISLLLFALTRADHLVMTTLEQGRHAPPLIAGSLTHLTTELDHRVDALSTELYQRVDSAVVQGSSLVRGALDAAASYELSAALLPASHTAPAATSPGAAAEAPDEDLAAPAPEATTVSGWLPRLLGIRPWQETPAAGHPRSRHDDQEPDPPRTGDGSQHQGGSP